MRSMVALLFALALTGCRCPPLVERWDTPEATLAQWQARLCRDDVKGEYGCFAAGYQRRFGGFEAYVIARGELLESNPGAAFVLRHADLADASAPAEYAPDGSHARIVLAARGESLAVEFECEAWVTVTYADGTSRAVRQLRAPAALVGAQDGRQWLAFAREPLDPARLADVRSVHVDPRWLISDLAGLAGAPTDLTMLRNTP
jgi:hypothetical protein